MQFPIDLGVSLVYPSVNSFICLSVSVPEAICHTYLHNTQLNTNEPKGTNRFCWYGYDRTLNFSCPVPNLELYKCGYKM